VPTIAYKAGKRIDVDLSRGEQESNWFMQVSEEEIPSVADRLSGRQKDFLSDFHKALLNLDWIGYNGSRLNAKYAYEIQRIFNNVLHSHGLSLREGLKAVYDCFLEDPFTIQIGLFLLRLDRSFVLDRMNVVANKRSLVLA
jgi:dihydroorotase